MPSGERALHLAAEAAAYPYCSKRSFDLTPALTELHEPQVGVPSGSTKQLADSLEEYLRPRARGLSLELLQQIRRAAWFGSGQEAEELRLGALSSRQEQRRPLHEHLFALARSHLQLAGDAVRLRSSPEMREELQAERWRWLSLALPPDLLIAALAASHETLPPAHAVTLAPPLLDRLLNDHEIAVVHLHVGAAMSFSLLWTHAMAHVAVAPPQIRDVRLDTEGRREFGSPQGFLTLLASAALARLSLAAYLARSPGATSSFATFLDGLTPARLTDASALERSRSRAHTEALAALATGRLTALSPWSTLTVYRDYSRLNARLGPPKTPTDVRQRDPLSAWRGATGAAWPETHFLAAALGYLRIQPKDALFAQLFWQYVRARCRVYRHLTQDPGTAGLDWFQRYYDRIKLLRRGLPDSAQFHAAMELEQRGLNLRSLEVRTSPSQAWWENRDRVKELEEAQGAAQQEAVLPIEAGLVLHFRKEAERRRDGRLRYRHADPRQPFHLCRFGFYYSERHEEALAIEYLITRHPDTLFHLRGLDMCSAELAVPLWVLLPLFHRLREVSERVCRPALRLTLHAGEDFRRLVEGLRHLHEPIEFGLLRAGDRLGHAVALGIDVETLAPRVPLPQPAEERLDDLLWELGRYQAGELKAAGSRIEQVRAEIQRLGGFIYDERDLPVERLLAARVLRHQPERLESLRYPVLRPRPEQRSAPSTSWQLLRRYLGDPDVYIRGQTPIHIAMDGSEQEMLEGAQRWLRGEIGRLGVVVEANPTSNMLIGELPLAAHPVFRLSPLPGMEAPGVVVPVALGDDDPATFGTSLADEFAYLYWALLRQGVTTPVAMEWLEQARRNAWQARFTAPSAGRMPIRQAARLSGVRGA